MSDEVPARPKPAWLPALVALVILVVPAYGIFTWVFCRIEVPPEHVAILIAKTGDDLPSGEVVATKPGQKGIQLDVLLPGRHFRNPLFWDWKFEPYVDIKTGKVGALTRLYGANPPDVEESLLVPIDPGSTPMKGLVDDVLKPGQYPLNPYAYRVDIYPAVHIDVGHVGVVCNMVGAKPKVPNTYLVEPGERGVQRKVLGQGDHYLNPYAARVYTIDVRNQRYEFADTPESKKAAKKTDDLNAVHFPSSDGFEITVQLTVEWSIMESEAAAVLVRIGGGEPETVLEDVLNITLIPAVRGIARVEGSKYPATNYISGESRTKFQTAIYDELKVVCEKQGIKIHSVLVNDITPPDEIAAPIRQREVAKEELTRNDVQLEQAKAEQSLARQTVLVDQEKARVLAETETRKRRIAAENAQQVALIEQEQLLAVAKADLAAAQLQAEAILARGRAEAAVIVANNQAEAEALRASVAAFKTPAGFAAFTFAQRMAPAVGTVFADPAGPFGQLFQDVLQPAGKE